MRVHLITIGDEILIGQIVDTNSAWMAQQLNQHGAEVVGISSVSDGLDTIKEGIENGWSSADVILMTGGLGPTKDDITKKALAEFFNMPLVFHQPTFDRITRIFERFGRKTTEGHRLQAFMPEGAELLPNSMGTAPGMWFEREGRILVSMPGVPYEMQHLMQEEVLPRLKTSFPGSPIAHRTVLTAGEGESRIADRIADFEARLPEHIKLAYLPNLGQVRLRLTGRGGDEESLNRELDRHMKDLSSEIPDLVFGFGEEKLEKVIGNLLRENRLTIATAESCTGGFLAHRLTSEAGSSDYFQGAVVAYANEIKERILGVSADTLLQHGAVSRETVIEMAEGCLRVLKTDLAIAVSGIAGPGGGTPEKPVGTIWMAVGNKETIVTSKIQAGKDRLKNIEYASVHALNLLRRFVIEKYQPDLNPVNSL